MELRTSGFPSSAIAQRFVFGVGPQFPSISQLQRRRERLIGLMQRLKWAHTSHFEVDGVLYKLPLVASNTILRNERRPLPRREVEYLAGFFDGDECVTSNGGHCWVSVSQAFDRSSCLLRFRSAFGGGIYLNSAGRGKRKPVLQWAAYGDSGRRAARILSSWSGMKQPQLEMCADWPAHAVSREQFQARLRELKRQCDIPQSLTCSWHYLAGFFDAEGHIRVPAHATSVNLILSQANKSVLDCIAAFLERESEHRWRKIRQHGRYHVLECTQTKGSLDTLAMLLSSGLSVKRREAQLALSLQMGSVADAK